MTAITKAVIPAAGLGTRLLPATVAQPKEMIPIAGKPAIQYVVEEAVDSGLNNILIVTGRNKRAIEDHFDYPNELEEILEKDGKSDLLSGLRKIKENATIYTVRQHEPNGLGDAILCAEQHIGNDPFVVMLGDDIVIPEKDQKPCTSQLITKYENFNKPLIAVKHEGKDTISRYGVPQISPTSDPDIFLVEGIVEKPNPEDAPSDFGVTGRYILPPEIFSHLRRIGKGYNRELQLTDALHLLCKEMEVYAYRFKGKRYDIGTHIDLIKANIGIALEDGVLKLEMGN